MPFPRAAPSPPLRRRTLVLGVLGTLAALPGCTAQPSIPQTSNPRSTAPADPRGTASGAHPPAGPPPLAGALEAADREQALADLYAAILTGSDRDRLGQSQRRRLRSLRLAHDLHAAALRSPEPIARPEASPPNRDPQAARRLVELDLADVEALMIEKEARLAAGHRAAGQTAAGPVALLWGSLAVAAAGYARALEENGPMVATAESPQPMPVLDELAARQALLRQLHAIVYGYQEAIGRLPSSGSRHQQALDGLHQIRRLRDRLVADLSRHSADIPVAEPAYVASPEPTGPASAAALLERMETALLPFCGLWVAAAGDVGRDRAQQALAETAVRAADWGAAPQVWPGWVD